MTRPSLIFTSLLFLCFRVGAGYAAEPGKPNIILIMADDLGYEKLGAYGGTGFSTPRLDQMAAEGMRFDQAYSAPICSPSRVALMTGRYTFRNYNGFGDLPDEEITFGTLMRDAGYATAAAGKWQLAGDNDDDGIKASMASTGFDEYMERTNPGGSHLDPIFQIRRFDPDLNDYVEEKTRVTGYSADITSDFLIDFIQRHTTEPFFIYYPIYLVHAPVEPTPDSDPDADSDQQYVDMIAYMDKTVGKLLDAVDAAGLGDNTLILFTGDNGSNVASALSDGTQVPKGKGKMSDEGVHVPLIARWTGRVAAGGSTNTLVDFSDFLPTVVDLGGGSLPQDRVLDGNSFAHHLLNRPGHARDWAFLHHWKSGRQEDYQTQWVRNDRYKLYRQTVNTTGNPDEDGFLWDIEADPFEQGKGFTPTGTEPGSEPDTAAIALVREELSAVLDWINGDMVNTAPTVVIGADVSDHPVGTPLHLQATVTDDGVSPNRLIWSVVSGPKGAEVVFSAATSAHTQVGFDTPGTYHIRLSAYDGFNPYVNDTVTVTVIADAMRTYETWKAEQEWGSTEPAERGPDGNPDQDPYRNFLEYAFGFDPVVAEVDVLHYRFEANPDASVTATLWYPEVVENVWVQLVWSTDLQQWVDLNVSAPVEDPEMGLWKQEVSPTVDTRLFLKLELSER